MTVAQLKAALNGKPDNLQVFIKKHDTGFEYGLANNVYSETIDFSEEPNSKSLAEDLVLVIEEAI